MAGISRVHGAPVERATLTGGYQMTFYKISGTNVGTADTGGGATAITEGNFTKTIRAIQTIATIVYVGDRNADVLVVAVDGATAQPDGPAYDTDATPDVPARMKAVIDSIVFGGSSTVTVTDVSGLDGDLST